MKKPKVKYLFLSGGLFLLLILTLHYSGKPENRKMTFDYSHKAAYGCFILNEIFQSSFSDSLLYNDQSIYENNLLKNSRNRNLIIITGSFDPDEAECATLFGFVEKGNDVFISAHNISGSFLAELGLDINYDLINALPSIKGKDTLNYYNPYLKKDSGYVFRPLMIHSFLETEDSFRGKLLGYGSSKKLNFTMSEYGNGTFFIHTQPLAFTNLQILYGNSVYATKALSYLPEQPVIIDRYYKPYRLQNNSPTKFILSRSSLRNAFHLLLFTLLVYMVFGSRRKQRVIPVIESIKNTSAEFIKTIGHLYFKTEDHGNIAQKKSIYFREFLREKYFLNDTSQDEENIRLIVSKTGVNEPLVKRVIRKVNFYDKKPKVSKESLMSYHRDMEEFYKNCL